MAVVSGVAEKGAIFLCYLLLFCLFPTVLSSELRFGWMKTPMKMLRLAGECLLGS